MKVIDYMEEHPEENLYWCKPYTDDSGSFLVMWEGNPLAIRTADGREYWRNPVGLQNVLDAQALEAFAKYLEPDYSDWQGYTDEEIILMNMSECGCASCPFRGQCEIMTDEMDEE